MTLTQSKIFELESSVLGYLQDTATRTFEKHIILEKYYYELFKLYKKDADERYI